ncbi:MAG: hypothetical protein IT385_17545 [Deltaproteobacteria bacterium]|nr:hypothetical protein [Deltaproteobacteria bacterium]
MITPRHLVLVCLPLAACGDMGDAGSSFSDATNWSSPDTGATSTTTSVSDSWTNPGADTGVLIDTSTGPELPPPPPPETEQDYDLRTPEAGASFLYIPSAALDALIIVDAKTLQVELVEVGVTPTIVRALPADDGAVVLNEGGSDVSIVRPRAAPARGFDVTTLDVVPGANRLERSPDGRFAFAFYDASRSASVAGLGSLQDVSAIRLDHGDEEVMNLAVGYKPSTIVFADSDRLVLVFCEDGISGIRVDDLVGDTFLPPVPTSTDPFAKPVDREIVVTPDGRHAAVRDLLAPVVTWVDLQSATVKELSLPDYASDLELTPDGKTLVVPMRTTQRVALVAVPEAFDVASQGAPLEDNPHVRIPATGASFGSAALTADGRRALLYTTLPGTLAIGMVDAVTAEVVTRPLVRELQSVVVSPDSRMAALIHRRFGSVPAQEHAYSLLDLATGYAKIVYLAHPVTEVLFTEDASELYALVPDPLGATHAVHRVSTRSFNVTTYAVPDEPVFAGVLTAVSKVAIALDNPTGWITFVDTVTGEVRQVNSVELNGFIE